MKKMKVIIRLSRHRHSKIRHIQQQVNVKRRVGYRETNFEKEESKHRWKSPWHKHFNIIRTQVSE